MGLVPAFDYLHPWRVSRRLTLGVCYPVTNHVSSQPERDLSPSSWLDQLDAERLPGLAQSEPTCTSMVPSIWMNGMTTPNTASLTTSKTGADSLCTNNSWAPRKNSLFLTNTNTSVALNGVNPA